MSVQELLVERPQLSIGAVLVIGVLVAAVSAFMPLLSVMIIGATLLLLVLGLSRSLILAILVMSGTVDLFTGFNLGPISTMGLLTILYAAGSWAIWAMRPRWTPQRMPTALPLLMLLGWGVIGVFLWYTPSVNSMQNLLVIASFLGILVLSARDNRDTTIAPQTFEKVFEFAIVAASGFYVLTRVTGSIGGFGVGVRTYALFALVGLAWYVAGWRCGSRRSLWFAVALLALLVMSLSRTAMVLGLFLFPLAQLRLNRLSGWLRLAVWGTLALVILYAGISYFEPLRSRFFEGDTSLQVAGISINAEGRVNAWEAVLDSYRESPWLGKGAGSSEEVIKELFPALGHPHNDYLRILHDYGLIGFGLWLVGYFGLLRVTWRAWLAAADRDAGHGRVHLAAFLALVAMGLAMLTDNVIVYIFVMAPLAALVGASLGMMEDRPQCESST